MSKPTSAQRAILERMAAGRELRAWMSGRVYITTKRSVLKDTVLPMTVAVLLREGWIECEDREYTLTDAGRAALEGAGTRAQCSQGEAQAVPESTQVSDATTAADGAVGAVSGT